MNKLLVPVIGSAVLAILSGAALTRSEIAAASTDVSAGDPPKLALLVGVRNYKPQSNGLKVPDLRGTHNDVQLMRTFLGEIGFTEDRLPDSATAPCGAVAPKSNIQLLCSEQATKAAILAAFEQHLIGRASSYWNGAQPIPSKGPMVVFYYSGHGSQLDDKKPIEGEKPDELDIDETDGRDETIVAYDSDTNGSRDIRDDSLKILLARLRKYTTNIVFIADSCHSGTVSRGPGAKNLARVLPGARPDPAIAEKNADMPADNSSITISGALSSQLSYEDHVVDPVTKTDTIDGLLTYYLVQNARQYPGATYRELIGLVQNGIAASGRTQTPQVEGDIDRVAFGSAGSAGRRSIAIRCTGTKCSAPSAAGLDVQLEAGEIVGAKKGVPVAVYAPDARELVGTRSLLATGLVTASTPFSATATVSAVDKNLSEIPPLAKVVLVAPGFTDRRRSIAVDIARDASQDLKGLATELRKNPFYEPSETADSLVQISTGRFTSDLAVVRAAFADYSAARTESSVRAPKDQKGYFIADAKGVPLYDLWVPDSPDAATELQRALEKHAKIENLRALQNRMSGLNNSVKVEQVRYKGVAWNSSDKCTPIEFTAAERGAIVAGTPRIRRSEAFDIKVTNDSSTPLFLYVVSINSAGAVKVIFPDPIGANEIIAAHRSFATSKGECESLWGFPDENGIPAPTGYETVKVIVSEKPIAAELLEQTAIVKQTRGPSNPLEQLLMDSALNSRTRGFGGGNGLDGWAAFNINYVVVP